MNERLRWLVATAASFRKEAAGVKTIVFDVPDWPGHFAGQHVDIRLTAEDGYVAQRSYSLGTPAGMHSQIELTLESVDGGEVSPFLLNELRTGDSIELRGPIGGYFTWSPGGNDPLMLVGGGSGVVPLMSMLRTRIISSIHGPARLLYSSRSRNRIIYGDELTAMEQEGDGLTVIHTLTREVPAGWTGELGRIDLEMLARTCFPVSEQPEIFICGPTPFVEVVADDLISIGHPEKKIRTERFGPSGDLR